MPAPRPRLHFAWTWPLVALLMAAGPAFGDAPADDAADNTAEPIDAGALRQHVAVLTELASDDYETRVAATERLLADDTLELEELIELYRRAETPEQRHRLLDIARHHTVRQMRERIFERADRRGSIGITFDPRPAGTVAGVDEPAIKVVRTMPGFPAYAQLRAGDLLLAIDGEPLAGTDQDFKDRIQARRRGETLKFTVLRDGRRVERRVLLASLQALESVYERTDLVPAASRHRLSAPFRAQWHSIRDDLRGVGPEPTTLRVPREP